MPRTEAQRQASIANGQKSRGPVTAEGKKRSRRNALKHGFTGDGVALPPELEAALRVEVDGFKKSIQPRDYFEVRAVEQLALASVRLILLQQSDLASMFARARDARRDWDERGLFSLRANARQFRKDPIGAVHDLKRSAEGCDVLIQSWQEIRDLLEREGTLTFLQAERAWYLVGAQRRAPEPIDSPRLVQFHAALQAILFHDPQAGSSDDLNNTTQNDSYTISNEQAKQIVIAFIEEEQAALEERSEWLWEEFDGPDREDAARCALFDPSPEAAQRARYINEADRQRRRALEDIRRHRRELEAAGLTAAGPVEPPAVPNLAPAPAPEPEPDPESEPEPTASTEPDSSQEETSTEPAAAAAPSPPRRVRFVDPSALAELRTSPLEIEPEPINGFRSQAPDRAV